MSSTLTFQKIRENQRIPRDRLNVQDSFGSLIHNNVIWFRADGKSELVKIVRRILAIVTAAFLALSLAGIPVLIQAVNAWGSLSTPGPLSRR